MLDCLDEDGQRYIVIHTDLLEAVCELAVLLEVGLGTMGFFVGYFTGSDAG